MGRHRAVSKTNTVETSTSGSSSSFNISEAVQRVGDETMTSRKQSKARRLTRAISGTVMATTIVIAGYNSLNDSAPSTITASEGTPSGDAPNESGKTKPKEETPVQSLDCRLNSTFNPDQLDGGTVIGVELGNNGTTMPDKYVAGAYNPSTHEYDTSSISLGTFDSDTHSFNPGAVVAKKAIVEAGVRIPDGTLEPGSSVVIYAQSGDTTELCGGFEYTSDGGIDTGSTGEESVYPQTMPTS